MAEDDSVKASTQARTAVKQMGAIIGGELLTAITKLGKEGDTLADPNHWSGPVAAQFRGDWDANKKTLAKMKTDLEEIKTKVDKVTANIMAAGGVQGT